MARTPSPAEVERLASQLLSIGVISPDQRVRLVERGATDTGFASAFYEAAITSGPDRVSMIARLVGPPQSPLGPSSEASGEGAEGPPPVTAYYPSASPPQFTALSTYASLVAGVGWVVIVLGVIGLLVSLFGPADPFVKLGGVFSSVVTAVMGLGLVAAGQLMECFVAIQRDTREIAQLMRERAS